MPAEPAYLAEPALDERAELEAALDSAEGALAALQGTAGEGRLAEAEREIASLKEQLAILRQALDRASFRPLKGGIKTTTHAAYVLGLASEWGLDEATVNARYRLLAPIYHPDGGQLADAERMAQLIEARTLLLRHLRQG